MNDDSTLNQLIGILYSCESFESPTDISRLADAFLARSIDRKERLCSGQAESPAVQVLRLDRCTSDSAIPEITPLNGCSHDSDDDDEIVIH